MGPLRKAFEGPSQGRGEEGAAAIEFALFLPFLLLLLTGVVEIGFSAYEAMQVSNAVNAGAVYAAAKVGGTFDATSVANAAVAGAVLPTQLKTLTATPAPTQFCGCPTATGITNAGAPTSGSCASVATCSGGSKPGLYVKVNASLAHSTIFPTTWGLPATFTATAVIRIN